MTHAIVLIRSERAALATLGAELANIDGVAEAYSVAGDWDFVAIIRVPDHDHVAEVVTQQISRVSKVSRTLTLIAFQAYSRHDLESVFSIGQ